MDKNDKFLYFSMKLGHETHLAGDYLYNGYIDLYDIDKLPLDENNLIMIFLNLSMGIERLMKVIILLTHEIKYGNGHDITETLAETRKMGHNLSSLKNKIEGSLDYKFGREEELVLSMISEIYQNERYSHTDTNKKFDHQINKINNKINRLSWEEINRDDLGVTRIPTKTKENLLHFIDNIINQLVTLLNNCSKKLNVYTYETESTTKFYIFNYSSKPSFYFIRRKLAIRELIFYQTQKVKNKEDTQKYWGFSPLDFDKSLIPDYINDLLSNLSLSRLIDEVESLYEDMEEFEKIEELDIQQLICESVDRTEEPEEDLPKRIYNLYNIPLEYLLEDEEQL